MVIYDIRKGIKKVKTKTALTVTGAAVGTAGLVAALVLPLAARADSSQVIVTPANTQGWSTADTRPGGAVIYSSDTTALGNPHNGALELTTDSTNAAKAQYLHTASGSINNVSELSYYTKQISGPAVADPSYQLGINTGGGFTNLVFEPYWNTTQGPVVIGDWQSWNVANGLFWSSSTVTCSNGTLQAGAGGPPLYTLQQVQSACPEATVADFGVNVGTYNPGYDVEADLVDFNGTTYNFEPYQVASDKDQCKQGGWQSLTDSNGNSFKNQGLCVSYTEHNNDVGQDDMHAH